MTQHRARTYKKAGANINGSDQHVYFVRLEPLLLHRGIYVS